MVFHFAHNNFHVLDLQRSLQFYEKALGLQEARRKQTPDGKMTLVFLCDGEGDHQLELTYLADRTAPYDLGDNEFHLAFSTDDIEGARTLHKQMGCITYEKEPGGLYFIKDPDGYEIEIMPKA